MDWNPLGPVERHAGSLIFPQHWLEAHSVLLLQPCFFPYSVELLSFCRHGLFAGQSFAFLYCCCSYPNKISQDILASYPKFLPRLLAAAFLSLSTSGAVQPGVRQLTSSASVSDELSLAAVAHLGCLVLVHVHHQESLGNQLSDPHYRARFTWFFWTSLQSTPYIPFCRLLPSFLETYFAASPLAIRSNSSNNEVYLREIPPNVCNCLRKFMVVVTY